MRIKAKTQEDFDYILQMNCSSLPLGGLEIDIDQDVKCYLIKAGCKFEEVEAELASDNIGLPLKAAPTGKRDMQKIMIILYPNDGRADIQTTSRLCDYQWTHSPPPDEELSDAFKAFRDELNALHGVQQLNIGKHEICFERYEVFEWDEILPKAIEILKKHYPDEYAEPTTDDRTKMSSGRFNPERDDLD